MSGARLLQRLEHSAADQEMHQPGGGCSQDLLDAAAAIRRLRDLLYSAGEGVSTHHLTGSDTYRCAFCESDTIRGLEQRHEAGCRLAAVMAEFDEPA